MLNGHLHYPLPAGIDKPLNEAAADKIRDYRADYKIHPFNSIFFKALRETDLFFAASGVEHAQHKQDHFRFRGAAFYSQLKSKVGNILAKDTDPAYQP